jgi:hypothetical protein
MNKSCFPSFILPHTMGRLCFPRGLGISKSRRGDLPKGFANLRRSSYPFASSLLVLALTFSSSFSQTTPEPPSAAIPPPTAPYWEVPPLPRAWKISATLKNPSSTSASPASNPALSSDAYFIKQTRVVQSKDLRQEILTYGNGSTTESWVASGCLLFEQLTDKNIHLFPNFPMAGTLFPELSWVDISNYIGTEKKDGKLCYLFSTKITGSFASKEIGKMLQSQLDALKKQGKDFKPTPLQEITIKAWIDVETKFPVASEDAIQSKSYSLILTPDSLKLPDRFASALKNHQDELAAPAQHRMKF